MKATAGRKRLGAQFILPLVSAVSVAVGLGLWELVADQLPRLILPPPSAVLARMAEPAFFAALAGALGQSLVQLAIGFGLTFATAVPLGIVIGRSPVLSRITEPVITAVYAIPPVAFVPFLIIWLGLFTEGRVALIVLMSFFDVLVVILAGARDVRRSLVDVGRSFGASHAQQLRLIVLPALLPFFFGALRVGLARAVNAMITAELFFAAVNLGAIMKQATQNFDAASALSVVLLICALGLLAQSAVTAIESRVLAWHLRT